MGVRLKTVAETPWKKVDLKDQGSFEVSVRSPTYDELMRDQAQQQLAWYDGSAEASIEARLHSRMDVITGWKDVEGADGQPLTYSLDNLKAICVQLGALPALLEVVSQQFYGLQETEAKNSGELSSESTAGTAEPKTDPIDQSLESTPA